MKKFLAILTCLVTFSFAEDCPSIKKKVSDTRDACEKLETAAKLGGFFSSKAKQAEAKLKDCKDLLKTLEMAMGSCSENDDAVGETRDNAGYAYNELDDESSGSRSQSGSSSYGSTDEKDKTSSTSGATNSMAIDLFLSFNFMSQTVDYVKETIWGLGGTFAIGGRIGINENMSFGVGGAIDYRRFSEDGVEYDYEYEECINMFFINVPLYLRLGKQSGPGLEVGGMPSIYISGFSHYNTKYIGGFGSEERSGYSSLENVSTMGFSILLGGEFPISEGVRIHARYTYMLTNMADTKPGYSLIKVNPYQLQVGLTFAR